MITKEEVMDFIKSFASSAGKNLDNGELRAFWHQMTHCPPSGK